MDGGAYCLILRIPRACAVRVGALGRVRFSAGVYVYVGSAMRGLSARVARHRRRAKRKHWHIDYLTGRRGVRITEVFVRFSQERQECHIAQAVAGAGEVIRGFGSSDCKCAGHLFRLKKADLRLFEGLGMRRMDSVS